MITLLLLIRATYIYGVVLHTHPVRGESHNQRNTTGEVATPCYCYAIKTNANTIRLQVSQPASALCSKASGHE